MVEAQSETVSKLEHLIGSHRSDVAQQGVIVSQLEALANIAVLAASAREKVTSAEESLRAATARLSAEGSVVENVDAEDVAAARATLGSLEHQLQEAREQHTLAITHKKTLGAEAARLTSEILERETSILRGKKSLAEIEQNQQSLIEATAQEKAEEAEISRLTSEVSRLTSEITGLSSRLAKIKNILVTLRDNEGDAHCPTCNSALSDIKELEGTFEEELASIENELIASTDLLNSLRGQEKKVSNQFARLKVSIRSLQGSVDQRPSVEAHIQEASAQVALHQARVFEISQEDAALDKTLAELIVSGKALATSVAEKKAEVQSVERAFEGRTRIASLRQEKQTWEARVAAESEALEAVLSEAKASGGEVPLEEAPGRYSAALALLRTLEEQRDEVVSEKRVQEERLNSLRRDAQREENMFERKRVALHNLSQFAAISDTLDEFRKDRIAQIAPELSETATALISSMTSGRFTEVILDEDFTPSVINDAGEVLMASQLSGGEESIVALALRVALGDLITGGVGGLLWLDEVLTAQDATRRSSLMNTLSHIAGRQIVLISHTPESTDSVDKIVHLVATDEGSFLSED